MVKISEEFIFRLKTICDITSVVSNYLELKFSGKNKKCCCPFHSEKTPSFVVFEETDSFYCFGCGIGGDVITFIEKIENLEYIEAVRFLCKMAGLPFPEEGVDDLKAKKKEKILKINKIAARFFFENLKKKEGLKGLKYLVQNRGIRKNTIIKFGLGIALNSWNSLKDHLKNRGFTYEEIEEADLIVKSKNGGFYDKFRNRVIFPIIDLKGDVVGFGGRSLSEDSGPKYLNSSDTLVFKKSFGVYSLNFAKNSKLKEFLLCEGYFDVLTLHQNGFDSAIATLGTSLTKEQARLLKRNKKDIVLAYDMDIPGKIAAKRASLIFEEIGIKVKVLNFSGAKDPDEFVKKHGVLKFKLAIENAITFEKLQFKTLDEKYDLNDTEQKRKYIDEFCRIVIRERDFLKREIEITKICQKLFLDKFVLLNYIKHLTNKEKKMATKKFNKNLIYDIRKKRLKDENLPKKVIKAQEGILRFLYYNPDKINLVKDGVDENFFNINWHRELYCFLIKVIEEKRNLDFSIFHEVLDSNCFGEFSRIINSNTVKGNILSELDDYLKILKEFKEQNLNVLDMTPKELEEKRQEKAKLKR